MQEYQPNSHKSKAEQKEAAAEKKIEKVVSGTVKTRENKKRKFADVFISEDAANVKSYVVMDVIVPAFKKLVYDIFTDGIDMILYGGTKGSKRKSGDRVSYRSYYDDRYGDRRDRDRRDSRSPRFDYDDLVFDTRGEAETVLEHMRDTIERYRMVTVADMYDMADLTAPYTSNKYGWTSLRTAEVKRVREGYIIDLPKAMIID